MKLGMIILGIVALLLVGGFGLVAFSDIPVNPQSVSKTIPNDRFFH